MGKKMDVLLTILCLAAMVLLPVLRSGNLPQAWETIVRFDLTGIGLRGGLGFLLLGVQMIPAFWFACLAKHYLTNMLMIVALALLVIVVRKIIRRKAEVRI